MISFRVVRSLLACAGIVLPLCILWGLMLPYAASSGRPTAESRIPSPAKAPVCILGPADVLV
jgi:hypothetical protein